jgi:hypothetical protein
VPVIDLVELTTLRSVLAEGASSRPSRPYREEVEVAWRDVLHVLRIDPGIMSALTIAWRALAVLGRSGDVVGIPLAPSRWAPRNLRAALPACSSSPAAPRRRRRRAQPSRSLSTGGSPRPAPRYGSTAPLPEAAVRGAWSPSRRRRRR